MRDYDGIYWMNRQDPWHTQEYSHASSLYSVICEYFNRGDKGFFLILMIMMLILFLTYKYKSYASF